MVVDHSCYFHYHCYYLNPKKYAPCLGGGGGGGGGGVGGGATILPNFGGPGRRILKIVMLTQNTPWLPQDGPTHAIP